MAHVHGAAAKAAAHGHAAMGHAAGNMGSMMAPMASSGHAMTTMGRHAGAAAVGMAAAANSQARKGFMSILARHPLLVFGLGIAAGFYAHKYRKEIIESATRLTEKGKDFALNQKENLEDLVAECKECADEAASDTSPA